MDIQTCVPYPDVPYCFDLSMNRTRPLDNAGMTSYINRRLVVRSDSCKSDGIEERVIVQSKTGPAVSSRMTKVGARACQQSTISPVEIREGEQRLLVEASKTVSPGHYLQEVDRHCDLNRATAPGCVPKEPRLVALASFSSNDLLRMVSWS